MQYIAIREDLKNGKTTYIINAIPLKNTTSRTVVQKIPHPLGSDFLRYDTIEDAKEAIVRAGFAYILPDGQKGVVSRMKTTSVQNNVDYRQIVYDTIKSKINSSNSGVTAAAVTAISQFPQEETFDILFEKIGEEDDRIRKNAIAGICSHGAALQDRIIKALDSCDWVVRNSALTCIQNLTEYGDIEFEKFIIPLTKACDDSNTIVQANALITLAKLFGEYQKSAKV